MKNSISNTDNLINLMKILSSVFVAIATLFISYKANEISNLQAMIAKNSALPNLQIVCHQIYNEEREKYDNNTIEISNLDGKMKNYKSEIKSFLNVEYYHDTEYIKEKIPLEGYFWVTMPTGQVKGLIETITGIDNNRKICEFNEKIHEFNEGHNLLEDSIYIEVISYLKITYKNLLDKEETVFYSVGGIKAQIIDNIEGENIFEKYEMLNKENIHMDVDKLNIEDMIEVVQKSQIATSQEETLSNYINKNGDDKSMEKYSNIIPILIGAVLTFLSQMIIQRRNNKKRQAHFASLLYNDLISIENYLEHESGSVNIRYSLNWQEIISECVDLDDKLITYLYKIYDKIYKFNYNFEAAKKIRSSEKKSIKEYGELKELCSKDKEQYNEILTKLNKLKKYK